MSYDVNAIKLEVMSWYEDRFKLKECNFPNKEVFVEDVVKYICHTVDFYQKNYDPHGLWNNDVGEEF